MLIVFFLTAGCSAYAVDWLAPFKSVKKMFSHDNSIVVWQAPGQYIKIVDQDWARDHRKAPDNDQPANISVSDLSMVLSSLQGWRPEDEPEMNKSVPLFTADEVSLLAPKLADALGRAGPNQDVVFAVSGNLPGDRSRTSAARIFVYKGKLNMIFGDVLRPAGNADPDDISEYNEPHRAGRRIQSNGRDIIVRNGIGIDHYTYFDRPRLDWIEVSVPEVVAAYSGPQPVYTAPLAVVNENYPADDPLSKENRKLREELARARARKEAGGTQAPAATAMAKPQQPVSVPQAQPQPRPQYRTPPPVQTQMPTGSGATATDKIQTQAELDSIEKRLQLLKELHDKGLITDKEFNAKRKEIVEQI